MSNKYDFSKLDPFESVRKYANQMAEINEAIQSFSASNSYSPTLSDINFDELDLSDPVLNMLEEQYNLQKESREFLKSLVELNHEISSYNKELVSLNEKILNKINSLDDTLLLFHKTFNDSSEKSEEQLIAHNALLLELMTIIEAKDEQKLSKFIGGLSGSIGIELLISFLKIKLGLNV